MDNISINISNNTNLPQTVNLFDVNSSYPLSTSETGTIINTSTLVNGDALPSNTLRFVFYENDIMYISTASNGIWYYNKTTNTGVAINTSTIVLGDSLLSDNCADLYYSNNKIYVTTDIGIWIYDITTNTGIWIDSSTVVLGDAMLTSNNCSGIYEFNDIIYVAVRGGVVGGVWIYNTITNTGKWIDETTIVTGDSLPTGGDPEHIIFANNKIYISLNGGVWIYEESINTGKLFNTSNSTLPSNGPTFITVKNNKVYVTTYSGLWIYNELTLTETIYDTSTIVLGDSLLTNFLNHVFVLPNDNVVVTTNVYVWELNEATNTGTRIPNPSITPIPGNPLRSYSDNNNNISVITFTDGIWFYNRQTISPITIISNVGYDYFLNMLYSNPLMFGKLKVLNSSFSDLVGIFNYIEKSVFGSLHKIPFDVASYSEPAYKGYAIDLELTDFIVSTSRYLQINLNPNQNLSLVFTVKKELPNRLTDNDEVNSKDIIFYENTNNFSNFNEIKESEVPIKKTNNNIFKVLLFGTVAFIVIKKILRNG